MGATSTSGVFAASYRRRFGGEPVADPRPGRLNAPEKKVPIGDVVCRSEVAQVTSGFVASQLRTGGHRGPPPENPGEPRVRGFRIDRRTRPGCAHRHPGRGPPASSLISPIATARCSKARPGGNEPRIRHSDDRGDGVRRVLDHQGDHRHRRAAVCRGRVARSGCARGSVPARDRKTAGHRWIR